LYRSLSRLQAVVLALVVLVGLGLGTLGLFAVGSRHWLADALHVRAGFPAVAGIEVGTRVHVQGLDAGEVEAIEVPAAPGEDVILRLRVAGRFRPLLRANAVAEIVNDSLLGGKIVRIVPGATAAPAAAEGALLASRSRPELTEELAQAVARLDQTLRQVQGAVDDLRQGKGSLGKLFQDDRLYNDLAATVAEVKGAIRDVRQGEGTLGKLVKSNDAYTEAVKSLQEMRRMVTSVKQNADAIKALPVVRSYVVDANKELIRPDCRRHRQWFASRALFEPERAVLTPAGRHALDSVAAWMNGLKAEGSEVVIAAFADPRNNADFAQELTRKQSEVVASYLKANHHVQRMGFWWWSNRPVRAIGCGVNPPPVPETEQLPPARVELLVFVPQN
jgi:phospholipid/cholesterol/gamma-HCH transport system substrate-binding protein